MVVKVFEGKLPNDPGPVNPNDAFANEFNALPGSTAFAPGLPGAEIQPPGYAPDAPIASGPDPKVPSGAGVDPIVQATSDAELQAAEAEHTK